MNRNVKQAPKARHNAKHRKRRRLRRNVMPLAVALTLLACAVGLAVIVMKPPRNDAVPAANTMQRLPGQNAAPAIPEVSVEPVVTVVFS